MHVADVVVAELHVHQARYAAVRVRVLVVLNALHERRGTVAYADDGYAYRVIAAHPSVLLDFGGGRDVAPFLWGGVAFGGNQFVQPPDFTLHGLQSVSL